MNVTIKPQETGNAQKEYSLPNIHGDVLLTTDAVGTNTSTGNGPLSSFTYDPFGNVLAGSVLPANTASASYAYVGQHEKLTESLFTLTPISMGARIYLPQLGRFTQVDPIEGGTENNYVYPVDPVNEFDLDGRMSWSSVRSWITKNSDILITTTAVIGCATTAGVGCAVITAAAAVSSAAIAYKNNGKYGGLKSAAFDAGTYVVGGKLKLVRDFGKVAGRTRYYRSLKSAIFHKRGINKSALKRLGAQALLGGAGVVAQRTVDWGISQMKRR